MSVASSKMNWTPVPILMYHAVEDATRPPEYKHFYVTAKEFHRQIGELKARGYQAISLDRLHDAQNGVGDPLPTKPIVLTFDDGYANVLHNAHPLLASMNWPYTVYLVSDLIGGRNEWVEPEGFTATPLLTRAQIAEMQAYAGVSFEAHTLTHPKLAEIDPDAAHREIGECKDRLEQLLAKPVRHFCYPYGSHSDAVVAVVRDAGYLTATTTHFGRARRGDDPLRLPRVSIYHVPPFSLSYGPGALNFRWRVETRKDKREVRLPNELSEKQRLYTEILQYGLVIIRNQNSNRDLCLHVADLLHNVPTYMQSSRFGKGDFYFLDVEVPCYKKVTKSLGLQVYQHLLDMCKELQMLSTNSQ